ncbi:hypothetical protein C7M84_001104 [Penaeus vannamei]|uniref:Uncharacterized protein n=1 Tax=Penaeus vannamei TaxID=6689 RepID=A0A3R7PXG3_PENVA|nr:hypothetical protein C7M84_001104 [Penaeus vannamei]
MTRPLVVLLACVALASVVPGMAEPEPDSKVRVKIDPNDSKVDANVEVQKTDNELSVNSGYMATGPSVSAWRVERTADIVICNGDLMNTEHRPTDEKDKTFTFKTSS